MVDNWVDREEEETQPNEPFVENTQEAQGEVPRKRKKSNSRAPCWKYFTTVEVVDADGAKKKYAECNFCKNRYKADTSKNGTSSLNKHYPICPKNPKNKKNTQGTLQFQKDGSGEGSLGTWKHDEARIKKAMTNMHIVGGLPFKFVENEAYIELVNALNGKASLPSRQKVSRDVGKMYVDERKKLGFISNPNTVVHLTTDTWTSSCQRINYMVLTGHFIDENWTMHKRILNFKPIESHKGEDIGREVLECIHGWGIQNVMTITVDNASSNDKAIEFLKTALPQMYDNGDHFQIRCIAHIMNLIVKDGLKEHNYHVESVSKAVRYIRHSTQRIAKFKKCMRTCVVETRKFLCGDCPTRWNSTFQLLKIAVELEDVFRAYYFEDTSFARDLGRLPDKTDFRICKLVVNFLEKFKIKTELVSASTKPLAHLFLREVLDLDLHIRVLEENTDFLLAGIEMRNKFDKYWGDLEKINDFMVFAVLLDPTMKMSFVDHSFRRIVKIKNKNLAAEEVDEKAKKMIGDVEKRFENFFNMYKKKYDIGESGGTSKNEDVVCSDVGNDFLGEFLNEIGNKSNKESELKTYMKEDKVTYTYHFDILKWWKQNAARLPILSRMAKDILGIQISTVASESAFSTGGRVLDPYRTSLATTIVEALVCTQDWMKKSNKPIIDDIDDSMNDDEVVEEIEGALREQMEKGKGKAPMDN